MFDILPGKSVPKQINFKASFTAAAAAHFDYVLNTCDSFVI